VHHIGQEYDSIPESNSTNIDGEYDSRKQHLENQNKMSFTVKYGLDLEKVNIFFSQQSGYTKYSRFLCLWDSRGKTKV